MVRYAKEGKNVRKRSICGEAGQGKGGRQEKVYLKGR